MMMKAINSLIKRKDIYMCQNQKNGKCEVRTTRANANTKKRMQCPKINPRSYWICNKKSFRKLKFTKNQDSR